MTQFGSQGARVLGGLALVSALALTLGACATGGSGGTGTTEPTEAPADGLFDQSLADLLPAEITERGSITIAGSFDNPPVLYADSADATKPVGVAVDLSRAIGEVLGVEVEWQNTQWPGQLPGLDAGTFDVVWGQATQTAKREKELYDMIPFFAAPLAALVPEGNPHNVTSFESLCGLKVGGSTGAVQEYYVGLANDAFCTPKGKPLIEYVSFSSTEEVALISGEIDTIIDNYSVLLAEAESIGGLEAVKLSDASEFDSGLAGIVFNKKSTGITEAFAGALQALYKAGVYQQIFEDNNVPEAALTADQLVPNFLTGTPVGEIVTG